MQDQIENPYLPNDPGNRMETSPVKGADEPDLAHFLPDVSAGYTAYAGAPLTKPAGSVDIAAIEAALKTVYDPEIPVNIYDLGLIYEIIEQGNGDIHITMSLTAPGCPVAGEMPGQVAEAVAKLADVGKVSVELVWEPAWSPQRMSEDAKMALDLDF